MFEHLSTPEEIFNFKLGAALTMEQKLLDALEELEENAHREEIKSALRRHREETRGHVENLEQAFRLLGEEVDDSPCPAIEALAKEGKATIKKTDDALTDAVVLTAAMETEHHEIAVYEALVINAEARNAPAVADLLRKNLGEEQHALDLARDSLQKIAREGIAVGASA